MAGPFRPGGTSARPTVWTGASRNGNIYTSTFPPGDWRVPPIPVKKPEVSEEPKALPIIWTPTTHIGAQTGCCGVRVLYGMNDNPTMTAFHTRNKEIQAVAAALYSTSLESVKATYPEDYKQLREKWAAELKQRLYSAAMDRAINLITHFVKEKGTDGWVAPVLRELVSEFPGAVNMGEYINPNTGNTINGWMIPTSPDKRLDKI